jgi:hypothetical protein
MARPPPRGGDGHRSGESVGDQTPRSSLP